MILVKRRKRCSHEYRGRVRKSDGFARGKLAFHQVHISEQVWAEVNGRQDNAYEAEVAAVVVGEEEEVVVVVVVVVDVAYGIRQVEEEEVAVAEEEVVYGYHYACEEAEDDNHLHLCSCWTYRESNLAFSFLSLRLHSVKVEDPGNLLGG
ncbi:hypothetical protein FHG87_006596 [Trinorchestia longiramus]|nr:hypothetical protein FHG87_006596 [Trinorchestia longiramus]